MSDFGEILYEDAKSDNNDGRTSKILIFKLKVQGGGQICMVTLRTHTMQSCRLNQSGRYTCVTSVNLSTALNVSRCVVA